MEINKDLFYKIFNQNFNFPIVDTPIGKAIKIDCFNAFIYSTVTGAAYFDNPIYPYTTKGLLKIFYNAFEYKFVTGIFDNTTIKNTPYLISQAKPFLFNNDKYIIPIQFTTEKELRDIMGCYYEILANKNIPTTNFIIQRIEARKKGYGMEPFMEYLAAEFFKNYGYIVETQIPLAHNIGSPDFAGYQLSSSNLSSNKNIKNYKGFHIIELALIRLYKQTNPLNIENSFLKSAIVGEAKTSTKIMVSQLEKYLNTGLFEFGFEIHPKKEIPNKNYFGLLTLDDDLKVKVIYPKGKYNSEHEKLNYINYLSWLNNYIKYYLIANLNNDEFIEFSQLKGYDILSTTDEIIQFINNLDIQDIFEYINNVS